MKPIQRGLFLFFLLLLFSAQSVSAASIRVLLNARELTFDAEPYIAQGRVLVPMRGILDPLGYKVHWQEHTQTVLAISEDTTISLPINSRFAIVNNKRIPLDTAATIKDGRTFVPLRFLSEYSGAEVTWNGSTSTVSIKADEPSKEKTPQDSSVLIQTNRMQGSGVVLSADGLIVTNYHVIEKASMIQFILPDGSVYQGTTTVVGLAPEQDIALLKIQKSGLIPASVSTAPKVGEVVTAVTSPNGHRNTVTTGVLAGFDQDVLSATAKISPGSSGGGLFNANGELIGVASGFTETGSQYLFIPTKLIQQVPKTLSIPLQEMKNYIYTPPAPKNLRYERRDGYAYISWSPVYGADGYHVYTSRYPKDSFKKLGNTSLGGNEWLWGYPQCFGITASRNRTIYLKVATVVNGQETGMSEVLTISR